MTRELVCDASVVLKWFHSEREGEVDESRALLEAHVRGDVRLRFLELTMYEVANVVVRRLRWTGADAARLVEALCLIDPEPLQLDPRRHAEAVRLAAEHDLTVYDGAYWAAARAEGATLVTADRELLARGAGSSPAEVAHERT